MMSRTIISTFHALEPDGCTMNKYNLLSIFLKVKPVWFITSPENLARFWGFCFWKIGQNKLIEILKGSKFCLDMIRFIMKKKDLQSIFTIQISVFPGFAIAVV